MNEPNQASGSDCGCDPKTGCCSGLDRRDFLKFMGVAASGMLLARTPVMAGPFTAADFDKIIPADKKLHPDWVKALYDRGARAVYRGADLEKIGMPVGGLCAGQLYLGGDGTLWHWDIFNQAKRTGAGNYAKPPQPESPLTQGFAIKIRAGGKTQVRALNRHGFPGVTFCGEYPIGFVDYTDPAVPVAVALEAFSPFIPLAIDDSSLPATIMRFIVKNVSDAPVEGELAGWLQNAVCLNTGQGTGEGHPNNTIQRKEGLTLLNCSVEWSVPDIPPAVIPPPIVFAAFEGKDYGDWIVEGKAFGKRPAHGAPHPTQKLSGFQGKGLANSWPVSDQPFGKMISPTFTIKRPFINFLIGGGNHPGKTCINLIVDGKAAMTETGKDSDAMAWASWDVSEWHGKTAHIEIVDNSEGGWGHIEIDQIEFADVARLIVPLHERPDYGTMTLALLDGKKNDRAMVTQPESELAEAIFDFDDAKTESSAPFGNPLIGGLSRAFELPPGAQTTVTFAITWNFPNWTLAKMQDLGGRYYATRFPDAAAVAHYLAQHHESLTAQTRLWHDTWYDSTLPRWFIDRTFLNISILATSTAYRLASGRFWAWEGVGCCPGTCTHVWHYAHAMARLFPELERDLRERVDYGISFNPEDGIIGFRGEYDRSLAVDGQAGTILRVYREHLMSPDDTFLRRNWLRIRKSFDPLLALDPDRDGVLHGAQHNTLDRPWFGEIAWLSSLYVAALRAGEAMAREMGDEDFAATCAIVAERGSKAIDQRLFNGEYYYQTPDPANRKTVGSFDGCEIDQVFGQSWAWQVGLGRILPKDHVKTALAALWKYNFTPDVGPFRQAHKPGRWYAMAGEGGADHVLLAARRSAAQHRQLRLLLQRMHDRFRIPGGGPHDLGRDGAGGIGGDPRDPRPLPPGAAQPLERGRVRRSLRPRHGQLRRLPGRLRFRIQWSSGPPGVRPAPWAGKFQGPLHRRRGLGFDQPEARGRDPARRRRGQMG